MSERPPEPADAVVEAPADEAEQAAEATQGARACPRCGTPYTETQEYCLGCGLRLPTAALVASAAPPRLAEKLPGSLGEWFWPVVLGFVIASLGAAAAIAFGREDDDDRPLVATTDMPTGTVQTATTTRPPPTTTSPRPGTTGGRGDGRRPRPPRPRPNPTALISWPEDRSGFTIVLASIPTTAGRSGAVTKARSAVNAGLRQVGVLESSRYSSLHPGYFVVFTGVFRSRSQAENALATVISSGFGDAYAARIAR